MYKENINYIGKIIKLKSTDPGNNLIVESTIIEALHASPTVTFWRGETQEASLEGITIRNGFGDKAIRISSSSPTIKGNIITDSSGGGIVCDYNSSPLISHNEVAAGIYLDHFSVASVYGNTISNNTAPLNTPSTAGGRGMVLDCFSNGFIEGNIIKDNQGFGIQMIIDCTPLITNVNCLKSIQEPQLADID